ncbi:hypothetical protein [Moorena sp. SIO3I6]|uniref:hypothetical protein n=1 Tax=Moorena sp. SIO3I6 TaxID=2607831 RepID=UPI0013FB7EB5|nr:hypothetical protein [Moorena sp. SIO3I6]NEP28981.1 hypothetical protein [Moorena sp. SIO3I6]
MSSNHNSDVSYQLSAISGQRLALRAYTYIAIAPRVTYGQSLLAWPLGQGQSHFQFTGRTCGMGNKHETGILRRTGILPVSIYFRAGRMPTLLLFSAKIQQGKKNGCFSNICW